MAASSSPASPTKANPGMLNFYTKNEKLAGVEFPARCMPDISVKTRIVAVCGITDIGGRAAPEYDGWFLSDFYLFNHLLRKAPVANQAWFTCCEPKDLVKRYTKYSHGNPHRERRVVLEERLLEDIYPSETLNVVAPNILLDRFLSTVREESAAAVKNNQNVLLLVFGYGDNDTYGVTIGSNAVTTYHENTAPRLKISELKVFVGPKAQCTLLLTSCYSGGWTMRPDLNMKIIATAGVKRESQSWNESSSLKYSGSVVASAICEAIFETEVKDAENIGGGPSTDDEEQRDIETYAEIGCLIFDHLKQNDRLYDEHSISFSAHDDEWTKAWRARTGIPVAFFKQRWELLSTIPAQPDAYTNRDPASTFNAPVDFTSLSLGSRTGSTRPLRLTMNPSQLYNLTRAWAAGYASSFPGANHLSKNTAFHAQIRDLLSGKESYKDRIDDLLDLGNALSYRLDNMAQATFYKDVIGLDYLDCNACEVEGWTRPLQLSDQPEAKEKLRRYNITYDIVHDARLFSSPITGQGWPYSKPGHYLAIVLVESGKSKAEVEEAIYALKAIRAAELAPKIDEVRRGKWFRDAAAQILKPVKKTLRSISPQRKRKSTITSG